MYFRTGERVREKSNIPPRVYGGWIEDSYLRNGPEISWDDGSSSVCKTCPSKENSPSYRRKRAKRCVNQLTETGRRGGVRVIS